MPTLSGKERLRTLTSYAMKLHQILQDSNYKLTQFKQAFIAELEKQIIETD